MSVLVPDLASFGNLLREFIRVGQRAICSVPLGIDLGSFRQSALVLAYAGGFVFALSPSLQN
jgi:hypothetical protein